MTFREFLEQQGRSKAVSAAGARVLLKAYPAANSVEGFQKAIVAAAAGDASEQAGRHWATLAEYEEIFGRDSHRVAPTPEDDWENMTVGHKRREHRYS